MTSENLAIHLRKVSFVLIFSCVGLLISLSDKERDALDIAIKDIDSMERATLLLNDGWLPKYINGEVDEAARTLSLTQLPQLRIFHLSQKEIPPRLRYVFFGTYCIAPWLIGISDQDQVALSDVLNILGHYELYNIRRPCSKEKSPSSTESAPSTSRVSSPNVQPIGSSTSYVNKIPNIDAFRKVWNGLAKINNVVVVTEIEDRAEISLMPIMKSTQRLEKTEPLETVYVQVLPGPIPVPKSIDPKIAERLGFRKPWEKLARMNDGMLPLEYSDDTKRYDRWPSAHKFDSVRYFAFEKQIGFLFALITHTEGKPNLLIPVKTTEVSLDPVRELGSDVGAKWLAIPFEQAFRSSWELIKAYRQLPFEEARLAIKERRDPIKDEVELAGLRLDVARVLPWGAAIIAAIQLYLFLHLSVFVRHLQRNRSVWKTAWIAIYADRLPRFVFSISVIALPVFTETRMLFAGFNFSNWSLISWVLLLCACSSAVLAYMTFYQLRIMWQKVKVIKGVSTL